MIRTTLTLLILSLFIAPFHSTRAEDLSVAEAKKYALTNHYKAQNAELDLKISKKKIWETTAIGLPQVSGSASYRSAFDLEFDFPDAALSQPGNEFLSVFAADNITQGQLEATQLLFDGTYFVGLKAAKAYYQLSEDQKVKTNAEIKGDVSSSYYLVLVARENISILKKSITNLNKIITETKALVEQGFLESTELSQLELSASKLETSIRNAERSEKIALAMLKLNMGMDQKTELNLTDSLGGLIDQAGTDALIGQSFNAAGNPDLNLLGTQRKLLQLDLDRYKMQRMPSLIGFYRYTNTAYQLEFDFYKDATWYDAQNLGISLNIPIWSSGMQGAKIKQAKFELQKMDNSIAHFEDAMQIKYNNALSSLTTKVADKANADRQLKIANELYTVTASKHKEGLASSFQLTQMENQLLEAQGNYINSLFELLNAKVELDRLQNKF